MNEARPSLDERYPVGHCVACTPWPKPKEHPVKPNEWIQPPRKTIALVRADLFDRDEHDRRLEVERKRSLAALLTNTKKVAKMSQGELKAAREAANWLMEH